MASFGGKIVVGGSRIADGKRVGFLQRYSGDAIGDHTYEYKPGADVDIRRARRVANGYHLIGSQGGKGLLISQRSDLKKVERLLIDTEDGYLNDVSAPPGYALMVVGKVKSSAGVGTAHAFRLSNTTVLNRKKPGPSNGDAELIAIDAGLKSSMAVGWQQASSGQNKQAWIYVLSPTFSVQQDKVLNLGFKSSEALAVRAVGDGTVVLGARPRSTRKSRRSSPA